MNYKFIDLNFKMPDNAHYFSGYYGRNIFDYRCDRILVCRSDFYNRPPVSNDPLEIGFFRFKEGNEFIHLASTAAWNWQQGCMLQWLPNSDNRKIIYNDVYEGKFVSVILDLESRDKTYLDMAYYAASHDGSFVLAVDNEHHYWCRKGYHYEGVINNAKGGPDFYGDGIWRIQIDDGSVLKVVGVEDLIGRGESDSMSGAVHFIDNIQVAPGNERMLFFHRWITAGSGVMHTRMYTADIDGKNLFLLNDGGRMTHVCWRNSSEIMGWGAGDNNLSKKRHNLFLRRFVFDPLMPLYKRATSSKLGLARKLKKAVTGDSYLIFKDKQKKVKPLTNAILSEDGHPSFNPVNENIFVSDQYPDPVSGKQVLFVFNLDTQASFVHEKLFHDIDQINTEMRSDLHPKWSSCGHFLSVDVLSYQQRSIKILELVNN